VGAKKLEKLRVAAGRTSRTGHSAFSIQHSAFSIQHSAFSIQHSAFSIQHSAFSIQHSAFFVFSILTIENQARLHYVYNL